MADSVYDPEDKPKKVAGSNDHDTELDDKERVDKPAKTSDEKGAAVDKEVIKNAEENPETSSSDSETDEEEAGLFNPSADKPAKTNRALTLLSSGMGGSNKKKTGFAIGIGTGIVGLFVIGFSLFNFLNIFRLEHLLNNIDAKTFARFNAQFSQRSDTYVRAYIRLRMLQFGDQSKPDANGNLFFRANKVDTGGVLDWYSTMKTSSFEKDLLEKDGVAFTSAIGEDGRIRAGKITIKNETVDFDLQQILPANTYNDIASGDPTRLSRAINSPALSSSIDSFVDKQIFDSDKQARRAIKDVVNDRTHFFQVVQRRRVRKNIQNMIGVRDWTFFETTINKYRDKKTNIQQKILSKLFPDSNDLSNLMNCIFTGKNCNVNSDNEHAVATNESLKTNPDQADVEETDKDGKTTTSKKSLGGSETAQKAAKAVQETAAEDTSKNVAEAAADWEDSTIMQRITRRLVGAVVGQATQEAISDVTSTVNPAAWWSKLKWIANMQNMVKDGTLSKFVKKARLDQYKAIYSTLKIAGSQLKTGQVTAQGVKDLMTTMRYFNNSEGWSKITGATSSGIAAAAEDQKVEPQPAKSKQEYCSSKHIKLWSEFAYYCPDQKPDNGGNGETLENAWNNSIGYLAAPIAAVVNSVNRIPLVSTFSDFTDSIISSVTSVTLEPLMEELGITKNLGNVVTYVLGKALTILGAGPQWTGGQPGVANFSISGGAGIAEASNRAAGGVASTPTTLNYGDTITAYYLNEQNQNESLAGRYASLDNPDSLAARSLYSVASTNMSNVASSFTNIFSHLGTLASNVFSGRIFAANEEPASNLAKWAGVDTYDIPQACQQLDPLDPDYLVKAVGVQPDAKQAVKAREIIDSLRPSFNSTIIRDEAGFWKLVYDKIGSNPKAEEIATSIYDCALLDRQVQGGLGYLYGYNKDDGLESGPQGGAANSAPSTVAGSAVVGDIGENSDNVGCAPKTKEVGKGPTKYTGNLRKGSGPLVVTICQLTSILGQGDNLQGGKLYGGAVVNSRVSGAWQAAGEAAKAAGVQLVAASSFRFNDSCGGTGNGTLCAKPGSSPHQMGVAIDFQMRHVGGGSSTSCNPRSRLPGDPQWDWLYANALKFGMKQYAYENWHWDPINSNSRCGPN